MQNTKNYNLKKPDADDFILVSDFNFNADIIDNLLKKIEDAIGTLGEDGQSLKDLLAKKADLDDYKKVVKSQMPDMEQYRDVLIYEARGNFPSHGDGRKLYVAKNTRKLYYYSTDAGTYREVAESLELGETWNTAYRGDRGKAAYDHSQTKHLQLGESSDTAYRGDRGRIAYDHSQKSHLQLGETSSTAYRGDRGKVAYDHSQSAHLRLGESSGTAYRGDRGKIAYDHSQSAHAPASALSRSQSYTRSEIDEKMRKVKEEIDSGIIEKILLLG